MPPPIDKPFRSLPFLRRPHLRALLLFALTALPIQNEATAQDYFFTTLAGSFGKSGNIDGDRAAATFTHPLHLCRDGKGNIYVTDWLTSPDSGTSVRRITPGGSVTTLARFPRENFSGLAVDRAGAIFVSVGNAIGRIDPRGALLIVAGMRDLSGDADGKGTDARFCAPSGLTIDVSGNLVIADTGNSRVRQLSPSGEVTTLADLSKLARPLATIIQPDIAAPIRGPTSVALDSAGNLYFADVHAEHPYWGYYFSAVWKLPRAASTDRWAEPVLLLPYEEDDRQIAVEPSGTVYATGLWSESIDRISASGTRVRLAGRNNALLSDWRTSRDGPASDARFLRPFGIAVDSTGHFTFAEIDGAAIRMGIALTGREPDARVINVSIRASIRPGQPVSLRLALREDSRPALFRGIGPGLATLMPGVVPARDLWLEVPKNVFAPTYDGNAADAAEFKSAHEKTGAFPLAIGDVGAVRNIGPTAEIQLGTRQESGVSMLEWFDLGSPEMRGLKSFFLRRLDQPQDLVVGFVISGSEQKLVVIRANTESEDGRAGFANVPNAVRVAIYDGTGQRIAETSASSSSIDPLLARSGVASSGAFGEAALLLALPSGSYTLQCQRLLKSPGELALELFDLR